MRPERVIVLSDIHFGPGAPLTTFRDSPALAALLSHLCDEGKATELVLAGDTFDFLQTAGYEGFDTELSVERLESILKNRATKEALSALSRLASRPGNEITILSGNHDPELLIPAVRARVEEAIGRRGSVLWADDEPLALGQNGGLPLCGRAIGSDDRSVWIAHGDIWDPVNAIDRPAARAAIDAGRSIELPPGSRLVYRVIAHLKPGRAWIDEVKPEFPAVLLLLLYLDPELTSAFLRDQWGLTGALLRSLVEARLAPSAVFGDSGAETRDESVPEQLATGIAAALEGEDGGGRLLAAAQLARLLDHGAPLVERVATFADHDRAVRTLLRGWLAAVRRADRFQAIDGPDAIPPLAAPRLPEGVSALVAGHTHGARYLSGTHRTYVNTGTWIPVSSIPPGDVSDVIDLLERGGWPAEAPRTHVEIRIRGGAPSVGLFRCEESGGRVRLR